MFEGMFTDGMTLQQQIVFETICCCNCGVPFAVPAKLRKELLETHKEFYCPNGHRQHYVGKTEAERLNEQLRLKENQLAEKEKQLVIAAGNHAALKRKLGNTERKLKRVKNGICPCCNRSFQNLHEHMKKQHPNFVAAE